jgi:hypothetical protein
MPPFIGVTEAHYPVTAMGNDIARFSWFALFVVDL